MDHPLINLINAKIAKAEAEGAFDDLPGAGKPLPPCDDPQNAVLNRIMKDNGAEPAFISLSKELARLRAELLECSDRTERRKILLDMALTEEKLAQARRAG